MKKRILSLCIVLLLCLGLLPTTVLAADGDTVYVGGVALTCSESTPVYATTNESGEVKIEGADENNYNIKWDGSTLTLDGAKIKGADSSESLSATVGIYAFNSSGDVSLNIALKGVNEIFESSNGIWVYSSSSSTNAGNATLTIEGEGSLNASGGTNGIQVQSNSGNAALTIRNADVTAENSIYSGDGVTVRAGSSSSASLSVDGGSLTATGTGVGSGINFLFGSWVSGSGMPSLTVSGNAVVDAKNGGIANNSSSPIQYKTGSESTGGIVFDGNTGTVYGNVTLQDDLTIGEGESLTLDDGASLAANGYNVIVDGGIVDEGIENSLADSMKYTPTITTTSLPDGTVGTYYKQKLTTSGTEPIKWRISNGNLPAGLILNEDTGKISGTPTATGSYTFTITAKNDYGIKTRELTIRVGDALVYSVSLTPNIVKFSSLIEGYEPQDPKTITIKNTGNQKIIIDDCGSGMRVDISINKTVLNPDEEAILTIRLKDGLRADTPSTLKTSVRYTSEDGTYENRVPYEVYSSVSHDMDWIEAKDPTHLEDGNIEYWYCGYCDKYYKDGTGNNELNLEDIIIPKLSEHSSTGIWHYDDNGHYHVCECGEILDRAAHSYKWVIDKEATSTNTGLKHEECTVCGHQKEAVVIPALEVEIPDTGIRSNTSIWIATILLSLSVLTGTVIYQRKKKES